eukprot:694691-Pleurochrysis_carterae.AAC.2
MDALICFPDPSRAARARLRGWRRALSASGRWRGLQTRFQRSPRPSEGRARVNCARHHAPDAPEAAPTPAPRSCARPARSQHTRS